MLAKAFLCMQLGGYKFPPWPRLSFTQGRRESKGGKVVEIALARGAGPTLARRRRGLVAVVQNAAPKLLLLCRGS